jgi:tetratricopeptide (TPR) repeat protein
MKRDTKNTFALLDSYSFKQVAELEKQSGLHQQVLLELIKGLKTKQDIIELATRLVTLVEHNYLHHRFEVVESVSRALINLPVPGSFKQVGQYYLTMCIKYQGRLDEAQKQFEALADTIPHRYKSRAIISLAGMASEKGDFKSGLPLYVEASRVAGTEGTNDPSVKIIAQRMIAVIKSMEGDHKGALADLNSMFPLVRAVSLREPYLFYEHLNSLAVELAEAGRLEEALRASETAIRSPYAHAYPQWRETRDEIRMKSERASRSFVVNVQLPPVADNVVHLSFGSANSPQSFSPRSRQARVINFKEWTKMSKEDDDTPQPKLARPQTQQMTLSEKQAKLLRLIYDDNVTEEFLDKLLKTVEEIALSKQANT